MYGCNVFPWNTILYHPSGGEQIELNFHSLPYYWNIEAQQRHLFFPTVIACSLAADILLILKFSNNDVDMTIHITVYQKLKKLQKAHDKWNLPAALPYQEHHCIKQQKQRKEIEMQLFERSMEVSIWVHLSSLASNTFWVAAGHLCLCIKPEISRSFPCNLFTISNKKLP